MSGGDVGGIEVVSKVDEGAVCVGGDGVGVVGSEGSGVSAPSPSLEPSTTPSALEGGITEGTSSGTDSKEADGIDAMLDGALEEAVEEVLSPEVEAESVRSKEREEAQERATAEASEKAKALKAEGNTFFGRGMFLEAMEKYAQALEMAPVGDDNMAVYHANRAACLVKLSRYEEAMEDCNAALELKPDYYKAQARRAVCFEGLDKPEDALEDWKAVKGHDARAPERITRLSATIDKKNEEMKEEMMGKLKDLGNTLLGKVGLSLDNFKVDKDPSTGSYSINFQQ